MLPVPPRDFTRERFKFRSTDYGDQPTRQDIFDTITQGLGGTGMPAYRFLPEQDRWDLVEAVRGFAGIAEKPEGTVIPIDPETLVSPESIARGRAVYVREECGRCHGDQGRGDGPSNATLKDSLDRPTRARDFATGLRRGLTADVHQRVRTGVGGTPMPAYDRLSNADGWDLARYVVSLVEEPTPPSDPVELGRFVVAQKRCDSCHVIEGRGGRVGPSLDVAAGKLRYDWSKRYLKDPRTFGKIYPYIPYRMPDLGLTDAEIDGVLALFAKMANRTYPEPAPQVEMTDRGKESHGKLLYFLRCTECHNFGNAIPTPLAKQQGPDLIHLAARLRGDWLPKWISDPKSLYPDTRMPNPGLKPDEVEAVRQFIWNTSVENATHKP
jgi:mono/diheme cytochrome c family protein